MAHAATWHLRGVPRGAISPAAPVVPDGGPATGTSEAAHPCLTGVGWNLAQSLRRYAAWGCELAVAEALLWLSIGAVLVVLVRPHDPLRRARSWRDAMAGFGCAVRRHGVVCAVAIPVLALGVFDEASVAAPQVAQQLLQLIPELVAVNLAGFSAAVLLLPSINGLLGTARGLARRRARYGKEAATEARVGWSDPRRRPAVARALTAAVTPPLSLILCVPGISAAAARGLEPAALVVAAGAAVALSLLAVAVAQESPGLARPRPWWLAVGAGATTGAAAGAGPELIAVGGLFGAAVGAGMEVGLHLTRSVGVFWRHRHQLPLPPWRRRLPGRRQGDGDHPGNHRHHPER